jgi:hypothetical protein
MRDSPPLLYGQVYGVAKPFTDAGGREHPQGEAWQFLGAEPVDGGIQLRVRTPAEGRQDFVLGAELAAQFPAHLGLVARLPMQFQPTCACDQPQLQQILGDADLVAVVCAQCGLVWAAQPLPDQQLQVLPLDAAARDQVWQALMLEPEATLAEVLAAVLATDVLPAVRVVAHKLNGRPTLADELGAALRSPEMPTRLPALAVVARLPVAHPALTAGLEVAVRARLDPAPTSDEAVLVLQAAASHAGQLAAVAAELGQWRDAVANLSGTRAALVRQLCDAVIDQLPT